MSGEQNTLMGVEYVTKQLAGRTAEYAGDESYHNQERVFGRLYIESEASVENNQDFENQLGENGVDIVVVTHLTQQLFKKVPLQQFQNSSQQE